MQFTSGNRYEVVTIGELCTGPDWQQRALKGGCKDNALDGAPNHMRMCSLTRFSGLYVEVVTRLLYWTNCFIIGVYPIEFLKIRDPVSNHIDVQSEIGC